MSGVKTMVVTCTRFQVQSAGCSLLFSSRCSLSLCSSSWFGNSISVDFCSSVFSLSALSRQCLSRGCAAEKRNADAIAAGGRLMDYVHVFVLRTLCVGEDGEIKSRNVAVTFDMFEAEDHRNKRVENGYDTFVV